MFLNVKSNVLFEIIFVDEVPFGRMKGIMRYNVSVQNNDLPSQVISEVLKEFKVGYQLSEEGFITIEPNVSEFQLDLIKSKLAHYYIQLFEDDQSNLVHRIRHILTEMVFKPEPNLRNLTHNLAVQLGLSYGYLSSIFSQNAMVSIEKYIILLKIERAKRLILEDRLSLKEISDFLSYSSVGHFSKQFKKTTGLTISSFRKIVRSKKNNLN